MCIVCKELCQQLPLPPPLILHHDSLLPCHLVLHLCHNVNKPIPQSTAVGASLWQPRRPPELLCNPKGSDHSSPREHAQLCLILHILLRYPHPQQHQLHRPLLNPIICMLQIPLPPGLILLSQVCSVVHQTPQQQRSLHPLLGPECVLRVVQQPLLLPHPGNP